MAIIFESVTYRNFLSSGDYDTTIELNKAPITLIVGSNGSGKSSTGESISFALFGKPIRNIGKPQLVNSINGKDCLVTLKFRVGNVAYKIERGIKPNIFNIYQNGILLNQESHTKDYQKILEMNILKMTHKSFLQIAVLGSGNFIPFMQLPSGHRREIIEDLLDIKIFTKMNILLKEDSAKLKEQLQDVEHQLDLIKERIRLEGNHIDELRLISSEQTKKAEAEVTELKREIEEILKDNVANEEKARLLLEPTTQKLEATNKKIAKLRAFEHQIESNISKVVKDSKFFETSSECPTCTQVIESAIRNKKISDAKKNADELKDGYDKLQVEINGHLDTLTELGKQLKEANLARDASLQGLYKVQSLEKQITRIEDKLKGEESLFDLDKAQRNLDKLKDERNTVSDLRLQMVDKRAYNEVIGELLKDTGIKTKITQQYIPVINTLVNNYLQILDFFVSFSLDENFNESIKSRHRDDFTYASFSEGEKLRIDMALLFTWRQIAKMKNSTSTNLLFLDEIADNSMDAEGIENLQKILASLDKDTNVFIISHKKELIESNKFDRVLEFSKVNNFSRLKE